MIANFYDDDDNNTFNDAFSAVFESYVTNGRDGFAILLPTIFQSYQDGRMMLLMDIPKPHIGSERISYPLSHEPSTM